uniref:CASP-like protein n=2 Tax=Oryza brachyantha TaxID=4533 RepID=J3L2K7_ORYBR
MLDREPAEAASESENMTLALALTETEKAQPPTPPKTVEALESPVGSPQKESALTIAKLLSGEDLADMETKPAPEKVAPAAATTTTVTASVGSAGGGGGGVGSKRWLLGGVPEKVRLSELRRAELGFRVSAAVFCLVSLSVMAADTTPSWSGDSFRRYNEYRYTLAASVLAFTYSGFQLVVEVHHFVTGKHIIRDPSRKYFNLAMDQILAYLLLSASSAALSRNDVWVSRFGVDQFAKLINASASMAFLAFIALGLSSIISAYYVFSTIY